jgi:hypothetical protein
LDVGQVNCWQQHTAPDSCTVVTACMSQAKPSSPDDKFQSYEQDMSAPQMKRRLVKQGGRVCTPHNGKYGSAHQLKHSNCIGIASDKITKKPAVETCAHPEHQ